MVESRRYNEISEFPPLLVSPLGCFLIFVSRRFIPRFSDEHASTCTPDGQPVPAAMPYARSVCFSAPATVKLKRKPWRSSGQLPLFLPRAGHNSVIWRSYPVFPAENRVQNEIRQRRCLTLEAPGSQMFHPGRCHVCTTSGLRNQKYTRLSPDYLSRI